jgi:hypothetical protein
MRKENQVLLPQELANYERTHLTETIPRPNDQSSKKSDYTILKELPLEFIGRGEVKGFLFIQIERSDYGYLYKVTQPEGPIHYEVFRRIEDHRFGRISYPGSKSYSFYAWTYRTFSEAINKFRKLEGTLKEKETSLPMMNTTNDQKGGIQKI